MYPNPPFNDVDGQRSADDSQSFAQVRIVQPRDWWLIALWVAIFASVAAGTAVGVHAAWPSRHTSLGDDTAATYLRMALYWTVMTTVLIALTRMVVGRLNRLCAKVKAMAVLLDTPRHDEQVVAITAALLDPPRHDEQVAVLQEVAAATVAAGQQLQSRSDQIVRGLDRIQKDRVAQGLARDGWDAALLDGVREVINKALTDLAATVNSAQQGADARLAAMERALCEVSGDLTRRVDTVEIDTRSGAAIYAKVVDEIRAAVGPIEDRMDGSEEATQKHRLMSGKVILEILDQVAATAPRVVAVQRELGRIEDADRRRPKVVVIQRAHRRERVVVLRPANAAGPSGNGKVNGESPAGVLAMPNSQAVELGRRLERKKWTNGHSDDEA